MFQKLFLSLVLLGFGLSGNPGHAWEKPNLVFMIADDCTYLDMEVYGGQAKTPHLNQLASEGLKMNRCFQTAPMCSPTRHNIYTGIYPVKSGAWPNHTQVYPGTKSIAHYLKDAGYRVALSGKTHINPRESFPFEYSKEFSNADRLKQADPFPEIKALIAESKAKGQPFCLFACSNEPHSPWNQGDASQYPAEDLQLPPSWVDTPTTRKQYAKYLAEITFFDRQCGALLELLEQQGVADNTLVMAVSEQGSSFPFAKWTCYEMGLASGMIVRWPGHTEPGTESQALLEYVDVAPTFLEAAGVPVPATMDGKSFVSVLNEPNREHKKYTYGIHTTKGIINGSDSYGIRSCGTKTHRYIRNLSSDKTFSNVFLKNPVWQEWQAKADDGDVQARRLTGKYQKRPAEELYDVVNDPHCLNNLVGQAGSESIRSELSRQLDDWMAAQGDRGVATEDLALTRQRKGQNNKNKNQNKNKKKNQDKQTGAEQ